MESNWRYNVWEMGWSNGDIRLIARLRRRPDLLAIAANFVNPLSYWTMFLDPFSGKWLKNTIEPVPAEHPHFPYGVDVLPD